MAASIGKLRRVPLREVWAHEAHDFTTWLEQNVDELSSAIGLPLSNVLREQRVGPFSADLIADDPDGNLVVIENQYGATNHDHLGKLMTYMAGLEAGAGVWVVEDARPEHVAAISWLNSTAVEDFYLVQAHAVRIDLSQNGQLIESPAAPLIQQIVSPSMEIKQLRTVKQERAVQQNVFQRFWADLLKVAGEQSPLHRNISPSKQGWISVSAGKGVFLNYVVLKDHGRVEVYLDAGAESMDRNRAVFDSLHSHREEIAEVFGRPLDWDALEGKRACRISARVGTVGHSHEESWPSLIPELVAAMCRLESAFQPYLAEAMRSGDLSV